HTVVSTTALETRIARIAFAGLEAAKERLECQIDTNLNVLQDLAMHPLERLAYGFPVGKHGLSVVESMRFLVLLPCITTGRKRLIVDPAAFLRLLLKETLLEFRQMQTVLMCGSRQNAHTVYYGLTSERALVLAAYVSAFHWLSRTA